jgi:hypothetical protein
MGGDTSVRPGKSGRRWAMVARLLSVLALCVLLAHPVLGHPTIEAPTAGAAAASAVPGEAGVPGKASPSDGLVHAGTHCSCQQAERFPDPGRAMAPRRVTAVVHLAPASPVLPTRSLDPPARPPRA